MLGPPLALPTNDRDRQQALLKYAAILEQSPYEVRSIAAAFGFGVAIGLPGPALSSARRLYSVDREHIDTQQMHLEADDAFSSSCTARMPPVSMAVLSNLVARVAEADCRPSFLLEAAAYCSSYPDAVR